MLTQLMILTVIVIYNHQEIICLMEKEQFHYGFTLIILIRDLLEGVFLAMVLDLQDLLLSGAWVMTLDNNGSTYGENSYEVNGHYNSYSITSNYGSNHPNGQVVQLDRKNCIFWNPIFLRWTLILDTNHFISNTAVLGSDLIIGSMISESGIGIKIDGNNEQWNGRLDDIAIWNRALSDQEVQQLYSGLF